MGLLVMLQTIQVSDKYFVANRQYEYTETVTSFVTAFGVDKKDVGKYMTHYLVILDYFEFWIPSCSCVEYDVVVPISEQNKQKYYMDSREDSTQYPLERLEAVTGIRVNNKGGADIDLKAYNELIAAHPSIVSNHEGLLPQE